MSVCRLVRDSLLLVAAVVVVVVFFFLLTSLSFSLSPSVTSFRPACVLATAPCKSPSFSVCTRSPNQAAIGT